MFAFCILPELPDHDASEPLRFHERDLRTEGSTPVVVKTAVRIRFVRCSACVEAGPCLSLGCVIPSVEGDTKKYLAWRTAGTSPEGDVCPSVRHARMGRCVVIRHEMQAIYDTPGVRGYVGVMAGNGNADLKAILA